MTLSDKIVYLRGSRNSYWSERIWAELAYAASVSSVKEHKYDDLISSVADELIAALSEDGAITKNTAVNAENKLSEISADAKSYKIRCISHAHIDMNWMWGFQETTAVTVDTFRTILDLMKEYPDFTYAQSQASTYKIIEDYCPEMIEEIKQRVKEGRWEVSASTWVETDKNMPNGESLARHILYTKNYLSKLLDIPKDAMQLDFEPDTFGHNITIPEIMQKGGVKYYYHCRGFDEHNVYIWKARSGASVLVYREPGWYNAEIAPDMFTSVPLFCDNYGIDVMLKVYGVGDHGGGPTRRDVERIIDMSSWPIMPEVTFGTYHGFFHELEKFAYKLPVVEQELNFVFTGCYTSQSRIKMSNRISEDKLYESETLCAAAGLLGGINRAKSFEKAWQTTLFNHFHDILPGSGVIETREYALGKFQETLAAANTNANNAMRKIAECIDTSSIETNEDKNTISEGAGVGYFVEQNKHFGFPQAERGLGSKRILHFFNTTQYDFDGVTEVTVWDWNLDAGRAVFTNAATGEETSCKVTSGGSHYWGHTFKKFAVRVKIPAFGYATYTLHERSSSLPAFAVDGGRCDYINDDDIVLENDKIKAVFSHQTMELMSLTDKATGKVLVDEPSCIFRLITESTVHGMTSWRVGNYMKVENLNETRNVRVYDINLGGIKKWIKYELSFGTRSRLDVTVYLNDNSSMLEFDTMADFHEVGSGSGVPQLNFIAPLAYNVKKYRYDVPFGTIDRDAASFDVPANSFAAAVPEEGAGVMLITDTKYGYRGDEDALAVDLIRASIDPDPYPEYGVHNIRIGVGAVPCTCNKVLFENAAKFVHPISAVSVRSGKGTLPLTGSLAKVSGDVKISAVKTPECGNGLIIRFCDECGKGGKYAFDFADTVKKAVLCDINENEIGALNVSGNTVSGEITPYSVLTIRVEL